MGTITTLLVAAAFGAALVTTGVSAIRLRWEDDTLGRHVMVGMGAATYLLLVILWQRMGWPGADPMLAAAMLLLLAVAAWRVVLIVRGPSGRPPT